MTDQLDATAVDAAAELGRRLEEAQFTRRIDIDPDGHAPFVIPVHNDETLERIDPEGYLDRPRRARGAAMLHDPVSFAAYVTRLAPADEATSLWADDKARRVVAVFNDHANTDVAGWRDHTATFAVRVDPDWEKWTKNDGTPMRQAQFAEFLQDMAHTVQSPAAADLVMIATTLNAKRNATFESSVHLQSGGVSLAYKEETTASAGKTSGKGAIQIPEQFTLRLAPFIGSGAVTIDARFRYRIVEGDLQLHYKLHRPDIAEKAAFDALVGQIGENTPEGVPVLFGTAPSATR